MKPKVGNYYMWYNNRKEIYKILSITYDTCLLFQVHNKRNVPYDIKSLNNAIKLGYVKYLNSDNIHRILYG